MHFNQIRHGAVVQPEVMPDRRKLPEHEVHRKKRELPHDLTVIISSNSLLQQ